MDKDDPYTAQSEVSDDCGWRCQMLAGVMNIYADDEAVERNEPMPMTYPPLDEFLADQAVLIRLISDGPLYVPGLHGPLLLSVRLSVCLSCRLVIGLRQRWKWVMGQMGRHFWMGHVDRWVTAMRRMK